MTDDLDGPDDAGQTPWSFRIMVGLMAIYLLYRFGQGIVWVGQRVWGR